ncbi:unnamed protein product [Linum trigynum]|uniref:Retrotransposon Copia-like N-terminal domain-containing protein n=1 Tax=Linum trigynum TaxID=586398 RepID=A0AAV2F598_9ROSI
MSLDDESTIVTPSNSSKSLAGQSSPELPSVYHLTNWDCPGNLLVGDVLTAVHYGEWVLDMKDSLLAKNKYGFVDGTVAKPTNPVKLAAWVRYDAMVNGWLKTSMDKKIRSSVLFCRECT